MDPGIDDALALVLAVGGFRIKGITTVAGNVRGNDTFFNASQILNVLHRKDIVLKAGSDTPLFYPLETASNVHGATGIGDYQFPDPVSVSYQPNEGIQWLGDQILRATQRVDIIATGPLTNIARVLWGYPDIENKLGAITIMGGAIEGGNITPFAEFNFYVDPDAAAKVLLSKTLVQVVGLDVTHRVRVPLSDFDRFLQFGQVGNMLFHLMRSYAEHLQAMGYSMDTGIAIHDAVAVCAAEHPNWFEWRTEAVYVVRTGELRGSLVIGDNGQPVAIAVDVDNKKFLDWMWRRIEDVYRTIGAS